VPWADNVRWPDVGKSRLAIAFGVKAIKNGFSIQQYLPHDLPQRPRRAKTVTPLRPAERD
jgi:hypothetical protein